MATYKLEPGQVGVYGKALVASTVDTVEIEGACEAVEVIDETGSATIYFTLDGTTPTAKGATTQELPASIGSRVVETDSFAGEVLKVKLISAGTPEYSVKRTQVIP